MRTPSLAEDGQDRLWRAYSTPHWTLVQCGRASRDVRSAPVNRPVPSVAVVDDEEPVRRALQRLLGSAGLEVTVFGSGEDFLAFAQTHAVDCVVLDLHMPLLSGFDVQDRLASTQAGIPVVVITAYDTPGSRDRVMAAGATAYFRKPVDGAALLDAVTAAVSKSSA